MSNEIIMINHAKKIKHFATVCVAFFVMLSYSSVNAESEIEVEGDVSFVSDYTHRGLSRSGGGVALQGNLYIFSDGGFSAGIFASTLDKDYFGFDGEVEIYLDYSGMVGAYNYKLSMGLDSFHGSNNTTGYGNFKASLARDFGLIYLNAGTSFTPSNREIGEGSSFYNYIGADVPIPNPGGPNITLGLHLGYENYEGPINKLDWEAGLYLGLLDYEIALKYTGSDQNDIKGSGDRVFVSLKRYF
jgi:uncharacterized protein (TIGR02001 family)